MPYYVLVRGLWRKTKTRFGPLKKNVAIYIATFFFNVPNQVLFLRQTSTVEYSESDLGEWCQEPANMLGGVPRHPCGIYTPSIHSEQFFGVLGHCPTMITQLGVWLKKTPESRVFGTLKKRCYIP